MLEGLVSLLAGGGLGSIIGLIGAALTKIEEVKKREQDYRLAVLQAEQTRELVKIEQAHAIQLATLNAASQERLADIQAQSRADEMASADFRVAHESDKATYSLPGAQEKSRLVRWMMGLVDFLRGVIRPAATVYSFVLLTMLIWWVERLYDQRIVVMTPEQADKLAQDVIGTTTFLVSSVTAFWFSSRSASQKK
jgi:hypothetical protein